MDSIVPDWQSETIFDEYKIPYKCWVRARGRLGRLEQFCLISGCLNLLGVIIINTTTRSFTQQKFTNVFSQFWRLEIRDKGVSRVGFPWGLSPACRWLSPCRVLRSSSLCECLCPDLSFLLVHQSYWIRVLIATSSYLNYLFHHIEG